MNRRSLLRLFPLTALGGLWAKRSNAASVATVIESPTGTVKVLRHISPYSGNRVHDATVEISIDDIGTREQWEATIYGADRNWPDVIGDN